MSTETAYNIRLPAELHKMMEEMSEINWQEEISMMLEEFVKNKSKERLLARAKELRRTMKVKVSAAELIREDRNVRARTK